jgi:hypothetical protein
MAARDVTQRKKMAITHDLSCTLEVRSVQFTCEWIQIERLSAALDASTVLFESQAAELSERSNRRRRRIKTPFATSCSIQAFASVSTSRPGNHPAFARAASV